MKNKIYSILTVIILSIGLLGITNKVLAASATVSITTEDTDVTVDDTVTVTIKVSADEGIGEFESNITYNESVLEFQKSDERINGGAGYLVIRDQGIETSSKKVTYQLKFKAIKAGNCEIASDGNEVFTYETGEEMSVSSSRLSLTVNNKVTVSENADLKSIKLSPGELSPEFNKDVTDYKVKVDTDVKQLVISADPEDEKSKVTVSGNENFEKGSNRVKIKVEAESGKVKEYQIIVDCLPTESEVPGDTMQSDETFKVENSDGVISISNSTIYKIIDLLDKTMLPEGYEATIINMEGNSIEAYAKNDNSNYVLLYLMKEDGSRGLYEFDQEEKTIQRYKEVSAVNDEASNELDEYKVLLDKAKDKCNQLAVVIGLLSAACALLLIGIIRMFMKSKGIKDEDEL